MTDETDLVDYGQRAGARLRPLEWAEPAVPFAHTHELAADLAATGETFWADISTYQPVVNGTYPYPVLGFRADTGGSVDSDAAANWAYCEAHPDRVQVVIPYVVFKPGQRAEIMSRLRNLFGTHCPPQLVPEIDMESGTQFAGPGDHSGEANALAADLANWAGDQRRVQGYANGPDWASCWPTRPAWMKRRLAYYSTNPTPAGFYARQYYGALPYGSPAGYPRSCAPFGSYVDMNITPRTISQILADYSIGDDMPLTDDDAAKVADAVFAKLGGANRVDLTRLGDAMHALMDGVRDDVSNMEFGLVNLDSASHASWSQRGEITDRLRTLDTARADGTLIDTAAVAAAVLAGLPSSEGGATLQQISDAFEAVVNRTRLITP